jgi:putative YphP/YqiW family bacilliredoxin
MDLNSFFVQPMRDELVAAGFTELKTPADVDAALAPRSGTAIVFVNSVCGCAAGMARPGMVAALERTGARPDRLLTVFAGQDTEATARARSYFADVPPSSPSIALLKDGQVAAFIARHQIEGRTAESVADSIAQALDAHCATPSTS